MKTVSTQTISDCVYRLALKAGGTLTDSCRTALQDSEQKETGAARFALATVLENEKCAIAEQMPVCQDTGMCVVLLEIGQEVHLTGAPLKDAVDDGVRRAYRDGLFRKSICDPLTRINTGDNTPAHLHTEIVNGDKISVTVLPKGFGSENMSKLYMLTPAEGKTGIVNAIVDTVRIAGSRPCAFLAKKALTREVGSRNHRKDVAEIELEALEKINALGIGAQGFGGKTTAIGVSCEIAPTHIAGLPVAVNIQCHCVRCEKEILL